MPNFNPNLIPTLAPGTLFRHLVEDVSINVRWYTAQDPVYFEVLNRVPADIVLRQLIIAKTLDQLNLRLGHQALYPYLVQPRVVSGTSLVDVPLSLIWDMHVSLPQKWEKIRLARIKRLSGANGASGSGSSGSSGVEYTGKLRLVFTGQEQDSSVEVALFQADVDIDSDLLYQMVRVSVPTVADETTPVDPGEAATIGGFIIFRTLDQDDTINTAFLDAVAPPIGGSIDSEGEFSSPAVYEVADSPAGGALEASDFDLQVVAHGTGILLATATNAIPDLNSDVQVLLNTLNFPFALDATRNSVSPSGITIPKGLFREFDIVAPAGDEPTGDVTGTYFPVWISRIVREDASADSLTVYLSTHNVSDQPSLVPVEFAKLSLNRSDDAGKVVSITPLLNLFNVTGSGASNWMQGFGRGHVVLSSMWGGTSSTVDDFFDSFVAVIDDPAEVLFSKVATRLSSFAVSRVPKTAPTDGQSKALRGSRDGVAEPSSTNRYVVEADQGLGDKVDFATHLSLPPERRENEDIERYGYKGALAHRTVSLIVNAAGTKHDYANDILPRLRLLFGRDPIFGDEWFDGVRFKRFNGDVWIG